MKNASTFLFLLLLVGSISCKNDPGKDLEESQGLTDSTAIDTVAKRRVPDPPTTEELAVSTSLMARLMNRDSLETFARLVVTAQLAQQFMKGEGMYTVFAPIDSAFSSMDEERLKELVLNDNREQLVSLLNGHVVAVQMDDTQLEGLSRSGQRLSSISGQDLSVRRRGGGYQLQNGRGQRAQIISTAIAGSNGTLYLIDSILDSPAK